MARLPRLCLPGVPQHVVQRGNNRHACFFTDQDYPRFLDTLQHSAERFEVKVHAYVLMTNHVHLLLTHARAGAVSRMMQSLGRSYVRYVNEHYQRSGTLWEGRFKSTLVDTERYFLAVSRYIELNPVRAGMVEHPMNYPWSSYRSNALGESTELLTPHPCYLTLGGSDHQRQVCYRGLFDQRFIDQIEQQTGRRARPLPSGGDRRSEGFRANYQRLRSH